MRRQQASLDEGKLAIEFVSAQTGAPAAGGAQIAQEILLEIDAQGQPVETDGPAREADIVARLDAIQVLEEETAACETVLLIVLRLKQLQGTPGKIGIGGFATALAKPRPEALNAFPSIAYGQVRVARGPGIGQRFGCVLLKQAVAARGQVI